MPASVTTTQPGLALEASPANLCDLVAGAVCTSPQQVADGTSELSYRELDVAVGELAIRLARLGVGLGDTIAPSCDNSAAGMPKRIFFISKLPLTAKKAGDRRKPAARFGSSRGS